MDTRPVLLYETASNALVEAVLHLRLTAEQVIAAEVAWKPYRAAAEAKIEHGHWDWARKAPLIDEPGVRFLGVEHGGQMQGMMTVRESGHVARIGPAAGRPLVYVEFVEAAPWNLRFTGVVPRYRGVGRIQILAAVRLSRELGFAGRIGLHSLPGAEDFYRIACRMVGTGPDARYYGLGYFELTPEQAAVLLEEPT